MRMAAFLFALSLFSGSFLLQGSLRQHAHPALPKANFGQAEVPQATGDGVQMLRRAEIVVLPTELATANRVELTSLRDRLAQSEVNLARLEISDPAVREQLLRQIQLSKTLLAFMQRQNSDTGKSPAAIQVERHLNEIEGKVMCEACHGGSLKTHPLGE